MGEIVERNSELATLVAEYGTARINRRGFMKRAAALGLSIPAATAMLAAAGPRLAAAQDTPKQGGQFVEGYDRDFTKMDTVNSGWADPGYNLIYEYTMIRDDKGGIVPAMAESWTISTDNLTWTMKIRDGLKFHSGAPCTAKEVADNFNIFRDGKAGGQNAIFWNSVTGVTSDASNNVIVSLSKPFAAFPETLATEYSMIENLAKRTEAGDQYGASVEDGTGPFTLTTFAPGDQVLFTKWADYPGSNISFLANHGPAYVDTVKFVPILAVENRANELLAGDVHAVKNPARRIWRA